MYYEEMRSTLYSSETDLPMQKMTADRAKREQIYKSAVADSFHGITCFGRSIYNRYLKVLKVLSHKIT